jgi:hypothetical protein
MAIVAFVLERVVLRTVRKRGAPEGEPEPTTFTSRGSEVDLPD